MIKFVSLFVGLLFASHIYAAPIQHRHHIYYENYFESDNGSIGMAGFNYDAFLTDEWYTSLSILEAVGGQNRAGYAVAAMGLGFRRFLNDNLAWQALFLIGAGGGGHLSEGVGGGLSLKYQIGLLGYLTPNWGMEANVGWIDFPDGTLRSPIVSFGAVWRHWSIRDLYTLQSTPHHVDNNIVSIDYKSFVYNQETGETVSLLGGKFKRFFTPNWYWGEAGYAAISGSRHGYIEGALIGGYRHPLLGPVYLDVSGSIGAGGGGQSDTEGGGFQGTGLIEIGAVVGSTVHISYQTGYTRFFNGDIDSRIWGFNVGFVLSSFEANK